VTLIIEHRQRAGWKLAAGQTPAESTPDSHRFRVVVEPKKEATLVVRELRSAEARIAVGDFTEAHITQLVTAGAPSEALQRALAPIVGKRAELAAVERQLAGLDAQQNTIVQDQQRLRENMKALRGSAEEKQLLQRYTRQLDDQENKLEAIRTEIAATTARRDKTREELSALVASFSFES
jgi:chromosome segregation ATPase